MQDVAGFPLEKLVTPLLAWYDSSARVLPWRKNTDPYRVWISEIMLQQTRVDTVIPYYERFLRRLPDIKSLAEVPEPELLKLWEGLGYYSRVRHLQLAARILLEQHDGLFPTAYEELMKLPGIGVYTAGAICSIAYGQPIPAVDGNVLRVLARLAEDERDIGSPKLKAEKAEALRAVYPPLRCGDFTQSLMELGALLCLPNGEPLCESCPLRELCRARAHGTQGALPVKAAKAPRRTEQRTVLLLHCGGLTAVQQRQEAGLLGGLWEFPNLPGWLSPAEVQCSLEGWNLAPKAMAPGMERRHIFTHIEWQMKSYLVECQAINQTFQWVTQRQLARDIPLPTAFKAFTKELDKMK